MEIEFDDFGRLVLTNYEFLMLKRLKLAAPLQENYFLLHPQLDPFFKICCCTINV